VSGHNGLVHGRARRDNGGKVKAKESEGAEHTGWGIGIGGAHVHSKWT
jgi:hypothetical protein